MLVGLARQNLAIRPLVNVGGKSKTSACQSALAQRMDGQDRKSVVSGKSVKISGERGGWRDIKEKKYQ